jgi:hypothetical protein
MDSEKIDFDLIFLCLTPLSAIFQLYHAVDGLPDNSYQPITNTAWVRAWLCKLQTSFSSFG